MRFLRCDLYYIIICAKSKGNYSKVHRYKNTIDKICFILYNIIYHKGTRRCSVTDRRRIYMASDYSHDISAAIEGFLNEEEWNYDPVDENGVIRTGIALRSKLKNAKIFFLIKQDAFSVLTTISVGADEESMQRVAEFITRANYGLTHGNFEMDYSDGSIRYKTSLFCADTVQSFEQVRGMLHINILMLERYGNALLEVIFGVKTPEEAVEEAEKN